MLCGCVYVHFSLFHKGVTPPQLAVVPFRSEGQMPVEELFSFPTAYFAGFEPFFFSSRFKQHNQGSQLSPYLH